MRVLAVTKLFPNRERPLEAAFNRQQFAALGRMCELEVVATLPWFPGARALRRYTEAGRLSRVPRRETIAGLSVIHPRVLYAPKLPIADAVLCTASLARELVRHRRHMDVVLGSWAYPHGVAVVALGKLLGVPTVIKLHGSDVNVIGEMAGLKKQLRWALSRASRVVAVSRPLAARAAELGAARHRIDVVQNGIDSSLFHPRSRDAARARLGRRADDKLILYVGWLEPSKGVLDLIGAFEGVTRSIPEAALAIVGDGSARARVGAAASSSDRIVATGALPHNEVADWLAACDVLALPSWREGTPNVVLEALASGRRVVATAVGGLPDLLHEPSLGQLVPVKDSLALERALVDALRTSYDPDAVAAAASPVTWEDSARQLRDSLSLAVASGE